VKATSAWTGFRLEVLTRSAPPTIASARSRQATLSPNKSANVAIVSLLHYPDNPRAQAAWAFDHQQEHQKLVAQMGAGASSFSLINYLLDPMPSDAMNGASLWDMNHQQAHDDAARFFNVQPSLTLIDSTTQQAGPFQWFLFINQQEHSALNGAALKSGHV
jgi:hypothetical protein